MIPLSSEKQDVRFIDGVYRHVSNDAVLGYCNNSLHKGFLNKKVMDEHQCIDKKCRFFDKNQSSSFWLSIEKRKDERKKGLQEKKMQKNIYNLHVKNILEYAQNMAAKRHYKMDVVKVTQDKNNPKLYVVNYIPKDENSKAKYRQLGISLNKKYHAHFKLRRVKRLDSSWATLEDWNKVRH